METNPFDLTPEQKGLLVSLARETGKPIPTLIAEALDELQEHVHPRPGAPAASGNGDQTRSPADHEPPPRTKHLWEIAADLLQDVPEEEVARLPVDGAEQHDHYIYGTPKHPA